MQATTASIIANVRHRKVHLTLLLLMSATALIFSLWPVLSPDNGATRSAFSARSASEPPSSFQGIQCDEQCRQGFIQMGVIPPGE